MILWIGGCAPYTVLEGPAPMVPAGSAYVAGSAASRGPLGAGAWWARFDDRRLDQLVEQALARNLEQEQLAARVQQANALLGQEGARLFPFIEGTADAEIEDESISRGLDADTTRTTSIGALLSWELDVWGRIRAATGARRQDAVAAWRDWLGGRLLLSASVAETYFQILEKQSQLAVLREQVDLNETLLELVRLRFGQGLVSIVDVLQQERQLDATRVQIPEVESDLTTFEYALDVLLGRAPDGERAAPRNRLPAPPPAPGTGVPSDLLFHRPDLLAAWSRVRALDYRVAEAFADRLPRFEITAGITRSSTAGIHTLLSNAVAGLTTPLFDAGTRLLEVRTRKAALDAALAGYSSVYLEAVRDVETALARGRFQERRVALVTRQLETSRRLLREARARYSEGLTDYLPVLDAVAGMQEIELSIVTRRRELLSQRVALHRALGGPMPPPAAEDARRLPALPAGREAPGARRGGPGNFR